MTTRSREAVSRPPPPPPQRPFQALKNMPARAQPESARACSSSAPPYSLGPSAYGKEPTRMALALARAQARGREAGVGAPGLHMPGPREPLAVLRSQRDGGTRAAPAGPREPPGRQTRRSRGGPGACHGLGAPSVSGCNSEDSGRGGPSLRSPGRRRDCSTPRLGRAPC